MRTGRAACVIVAALLAAGCSGGADTTPPATTMAPSASANPDKVWTATDLPGIVLSPAQIGSWQTATRADLTGPFTAAVNTNPAESPPPVAGVENGYRQTIGNPAGGGISIVRTILELFRSSAEVSPALDATLESYKLAGFTFSVDSASLGLGPGAAARLAANVQIAPEFASGYARQALLTLWRSSNLLIIQICGGDSGVTLDAALRWADMVRDNLRKV